MYGHRKMDILGIPEESTQHLLFGHRRLVQTQLFGYHNPLLTLGSKVGSMDTLGVLFLGPEDVISAGPGVELFPWGS